MEDPLGLRPASAAESNGQEISTSDILLGVGVPLVMACVWVALGLCCGYKLNQMLTKRAETLEETASPNQQVSSTKMWIEMVSLSGNDQDSSSSQHSMTPGLLMPPPQSLY